MLDKTSLDVYVSDMKDKTHKSKTTVKEVEQLQLFELPRKKKEDVSGRVMHKGKLIVLDENIRKMLSGNPSDWQGGE